MARFHLSPKGAFVVFLLLAIVAFAQGTWWIVFMAGLIDEKVEVAERLGADPAYIDQLHDQEVGRQVMVGMEGVFFLVMISGGAFLIYRSLVKTEQLKFHQQNFLMAVTHELKTPLASIKLYLDTLKSPKIPDEKKAKVLPRMRSDLERLERLVDNILEAGRFERSGYKLHRQRLDLTAMLSRLTAEVQAAATKKPLEISVDLEDEVVVEGDSSALQRALEAVIENSIKYNVEERIRIQVGLAREGKHVRITISDNGIGLERGDLKRIFDRFYRVGSELSRSHAGSGLGLYLAREIIEAHDGDIVAESEGPGRGARFIIRLKAE